MLNREGAFYLGNLGSIPLFAHPSSLVMLLLVAMNYQHGGVLMILVALVVLVTSIILHELGHGLTAQALGASNVTITLEAFGGVCRSNRDTLPARELPILIAGPAVSYVLWGGGYAIWSWAIDTQQPWLLDASGEASLVALFLHQIWWMNMVLALFNSLPIYPLDGGQVLFNFIRLFPRSWNPARMITLCVSIFVGIGLLILMFNIANQPPIWTTLIVGYLLYNAYRSLH